MAVWTTDGAAITWRELVGDFAPALISYARAKGIKAPEDLVQDVLVTAVERLSEFHGDRSGLRSWLFSITYRRIADEHRRFYRRPEVLVSEHPATATSLEDVDGAVIEKDSAREAFAAFEILGERERTVLEMRIVDEASPSEVAAALGISAGNVRVIQARALVKIRKHLKSRDAEESRSMVLGGMLITFIRYFRSELSMDDAVVGPWIQQIKDGATDPTVAMAVSTTATVAAKGAAAAMSTTTTSSLGVIAGGAAKVGLVLTLATAPVVASGDVAQESPIPAADALIAADTSNDLSVPSADDPVQEGADPTGQTTPTAPPGEVSTVNPEVLPQPDQETEGDTGGEPPASEEPSTEPEVTEEPTDDIVGETTGLVDEVVEPATGGVVEPLLEGTLDLVEEGVVEPLVDEVVQPLVDEVVQPLVDEVVVPLVEDTVDEVVTPLVDETVEPLVDDLVDPLLDDLLGGPGGLLSGEVGLFGA